MGGGGGQKRPKNGPHGLCMTPKWPTELDFKKTRKINTPDIVFNLVELVVICNSGVVKSQVHFCKMKMMMLICLRFMRRFLREGEAVGTYFYLLETSMN